MATTITNLARAVWGYLHGDDIKAADARTLAANIAAAGPAVPAPAEGVSVSRPDAAGSGHAPSARA